MVLLNVYIITDNDGSERVNRLLELFQDDIYHVESVIVPKLDREVEDDIYEIYQVQWCLGKPSDNLPILILRDTSITLIEADKLKRLIVDIIDNDSNYDIFYLCRWNDSCQKCIDVEEFSDGIKVARTYGANGTQAVYFTPTGRDIFLGKEVMNNDRYLSFHKNVDKKIAKQLSDGNITAYCTLHNIFEFDITQATKNSDYNKISPCMTMTKNDNSNDKGTNIGYLWFVIIVILILILAFAIARIGR